MSTNDRVTFDVTELILKQWLDFFSISDVTFDSLFSSFFLVSYRVSFSISEMLRLKACFPRRSLCPLGFLLPFIGSVVRSNSPSSKRRYNVLIEQLIDFSARPIITSGVHPRATFSLTYSCSFLGNEILRLPQRFLFSL